jgi:hypothetical protein
MWFASETAFRGLRPLGLALVLLLITRTVGHAEEVPPDLPRNPSSGTNQIGSISDFFGGRTPYEFWLTVLIVLFGLTVVVLLLWFSRRTDVRPEEVGRSVIVIFVITAGLILVTAGYSNDQIAPAFGLLGTIVGYVLGRFGARQGADRNADRQP